jgi:hypothetical protein
MNPQSGRSYSQLAILTISGVASGDQFGRSVAIDGDMIVVGAYGESSLKGAAYVFRIIVDKNQNIISISQQAKLTASNGMAYDYFGWSVAIRGKYIFVGAPLMDSDISSQVGSVYPFENSSNDPASPTWMEIMQFQPEDLIRGDQFGYSVAMDDTIAIIGTQFGDSAYVLELVSSAWTPTAKLTGSTDSFFGYSVAVSGTWIVVGARQEIDANGNPVGAVSVFSKTMSSSSSSAAAWAQVAELRAADGAEGDNFGVSVSISKDASTIVVGADFYDYNSTIINSGAAYLFQRIDSNEKTATTLMTD